MSTKTIQVEVPVETVVTPELQAQISNTVQQAGDATKQIGDAVQNASEAVTAMDIPSIGAGLQSQLANMLQSVTATADDAKQFLVDEIPEVLLQILTWYGLYNFIMFLTSVALVGAIVYIWKTAFGVKTKMVKTIEEDGKVTTEEVGVASWTHDHLGKEHKDPRLLAPVALMGILGVMSSNFATLEWLKIWVAPKLWLIEYAAAMVK